MLALAACYLCRPDASWPIDIGDDPSCAHAGATGGPVTWGVCRADVRNELEVGDLVVFFAVDRLTDCRPARYVWIGYATVAQKVSQVEIFVRDDLARFRQYPNLLIRPLARSRTYEHFEPVLPRSEWHHDWLWRLVHSKRRKKKDFEIAEKSTIYAIDETRAAGNLIALAKNYVVFEPEGAGSWIAACPRVVALAEKSGVPETWLNGFAAELRATVFDGQPSRMTRRTTNAQTAHPEARLDNASILRSRLQTLAVRHALAGR